MRPRLRKGQWSLTRAACRECGETRRPHAAKGLCRTCYYRGLQRRLRRGQKGVASARRGITRGAKAGRRKS